MRNIRPLMKRTGAYAIDLLIIILITSIISKIPFLNPNKDEYQKTYTEYTEKYAEYAEYIELLEEYYSDNEINQEEYSELIKNSKYSEIVISKYDDEKITEGEYKEIVSKVNELINVEAKDYVYLLNKKGVYNSIITIICTLLYFGVFQYFLKGQTIGKKLFKLKVVSASDKKINILNYILRSLIVNDVLLNTIGILFLLIASKSVYTNASNIISTVISLFEASILYLVLTREDQRGLHDLLFNTKVISTETMSDASNLQIKNETENKPKRKSKKKIIEAEYKEEEK